MKAGDEMRKGIIYYLLFYASCLIFAAVKISAYITTKNTTDLILALVFIALMLGYALRSISMIFKKDKSETSDIRIVVLGFVLLAINLFMPNIIGTFTEQTTAEKDYASMLNFGRPTEYYCHIENDDFNSIYQQLLDNDWRIFFLPTKVIPGNSTVRNVNTYGDNITVEYGDRHNTTVRFIQNRNGVETSDRQFTKLADKEFIAETSTEEFEIGDYKVTETTTVISSTAEGAETRTVYSYSWNVGKHTHFIETTVDMESKFSSMHTMIESMHKIEVYDSQEEYEDIMMGQVG